MRRLLEFDCNEEKYFITEEGRTIFEISASDMRFDSKAFYNGIYKNKKASIDLANKISSDPNKKGKYIYSVLSEIVNKINEVFPEEDMVCSEENNKQTKKVPCFDEATLLEEDFAFDKSCKCRDVDDEKDDADYAIVYIKDDMEPSIPSGSIVYVKKGGKPIHNTIGLFIVDKNVMIRKYIVKGRGYKLEPLNCKYETLVGRNVTDMKYLGKIIG